VGELDGLGNVVERATLQQGSGSNLVVAAAEDHDGACRRRADEPLKHSVAIQYRHAEIEQDNVWSMLAHLPQTLDAIGRRVRAIPESADGLSQHAEDTLIIVDEQDANLVLATLLLHPRC
jgi:hypothetical protein